MRAFRDMNPHYKKDKRRETNRKKNKKHKIPTREIKAHITTTCREQTDTVNS